jgi:hypothetical protein
VAVSEPGLLLICAVAFVAVALLLGVLAAVIKLLTVVFPERAGPDETDAGLVAAIHAAAARAHPGHRITSIEESR